MEKAIVYKVRELSAQYIGLVRPVIVEVDDSFPEKCDPSSFPNNGLIFIVSGYDKLLEGELYRLSHYANVEFNGEQDKSSRKAFGDDAKPLQRHEYPHVLKEDFDLSKRSVNMPYKPDRLIVLQSSDNSMYGPFDYDSPLPSETNSYEVSLKPYPGLTRYNIPAFNVLSFSNEAFEVVSLGSQSVLVAEVKDILEVDYRIADYIPDDQLLKLGNTLIQGSKDAFLQAGKLDKKQLTGFRNAIAQLTDVDDRFNDERKSRLLKLADRLDYWTSQSSSLIAEFLDSEKGRKQIEDYLHENEKDVLNLAKNVFSKELEDNRRSLTSEVDELRGKRDALAQEIDQAKQDLQKSQDDVNKKQQEELTQQLQDLKATLDHKRTELDGKEMELTTLLKTLNVAKSVEDLRKEEEHLRWANGREKKQHEELEKLKDDLIEQINQKDSERKQKLMQVAKLEKPYLDILNGILPTFAEEIQTKSIIIKRREDKPTAKAFIVEVQGKLKSYYGRNYLFEDIANFLICIDQSFLTVFCGLPGAGKTSLVTCLANVLGLSSQDSFLNIPTARGFTSQRDILGFYNPLSQRFQPATTGLYEVLSSLNADEQRALYPHWVLLDEANLSPMEHYFSAFLAMCDAGVTKKVITGEPGASGKLMLPASFRFLATINYDNTTEPLSPRMIDRVPIIRIEPPKDEDISFAVSTLPEEKLLAYDDLHAIFQLHSDDENGDDLTLEEARVLTRVKEALGSNDVSKGIPTVISPRKLQTIKQYCSAARQIMSGSYPLAALDYAVSQHVLPLINGYGDKYQKRLNELREAIRQLDRSRLLLDSITRVGDEEQKFYRYFI